MKKLILLFLLFSTCFVMGKKYINKDLNFQFKYNDKYLEYFDDTKIKLEVWIDKIEDFPEDSPAGINIKETVKKIKMSLEEGKYLETKFDTLSNHYVYKKVITKNNKNIITLVGYEHSGGWGGGNYINSMKSSINFFINNVYISIKITCSGLYEMTREKVTINDKLTDYFNDPNFYGLNFKNIDSDKVLINDIINKKKNLPIELIVWYKVYLDILDSLKL